MTVDYPKIIRESARLIILKALGEQMGEQLDSHTLHEHVLPLFAVRQSREWVHQQLTFLYDMGAITLAEAGTIKVATLTAMGRRHLDRAFAIEGVQRPSRQGE
ncbi:MAG: hypothetical protein ACOH2J_07650 [Allorhizobium sp.]